jgi:hypothetical protein
VIELEFISLVIFFIVPSKKSQMKDDAEYSGINKKRK